MLQLNNITTGQVVIADLSIDYKTGIIWDVYSNGLKIFPAIRKSNGVVIDTKKVPENAMNFDDLKELLTYEELLKESDLQGFEISTDLKNWCVENGSTGLETLYRILVPNDLQNKCFSSRENTESPYFKLYELIMYCFTLPTFTQVGGLQYLEEITDEAKLLMESFDSEGLIIDYKYTQIEGNLNLT